MDNNIILLLEQVERLGTQARARVRRAGAEHGLQPVHLQALMFLREANRYSNTPQALTEYLGLTKGTVSQSLLLLQRKGLIDRYADTGDKRLIRLELTAAGELLLKGMRFMAEWGRAARGINPARIKTAAFVLRETLQKFQAKQEIKTFGVCNTCRHCRRVTQRTYLCGLTGDKLRVGETHLICREHAVKVKG
jgi:DNA-binding MarR family transcriptional regulator